MKAFRHFIGLTLLAVSLSSCSLWNKAFPAKYGCPSNGKNVGAEKVLDGSKQKKPPKFKV